MSERTAQQLVNRLNSSDPDFNDCTDAAIILMRQHAEIERLKADAERVNSCAKNLAIAMHKRHFSHITQWEPLPDTIGLITQIDNMSCWPDAEIERLTILSSALTAKANALVIANARLTEKIDSLTAECEIISDYLKRTNPYLTNDSSREAAIATAVAAEREACAAVCEAISTGLSAYRDGYGASACLEAIRARSAT